MSSLIIFAGHTVFELEARTRQTDIHTSKRCNAA